VDFSGLNRADVFYVALLHVAEDSLLPEIRQIFGDEATLKFIQIFEGMTIKVPTESQITRGLKDAEVYLALRKIRRSDPVLVKRAAGEHGYTPEEALSVYRRIRAIVRRL